MFNMQEFIVFFGWFYFGSYLLTLKRLSGLPYAGFLIHHSCSRTVSLTNKQKGVALFCLLHDIFLAFFIFVSFLSLNCLNCISSLTTEWQIVTKQLQLKIQDSTRRDRDRIGQQFQHLEDLLQQQQQKAVVLWSGGKKVAFQQ